MPVTRNEKIAGGIFAGVLATVALTGAFIASDDGSSNGDTAAVEAPALLADGPAFEATFATPGDFFDRFDYGYSGVSPIAANTIVQNHGDHNSACQAPTTLRDVHFKGTTSALDFTELFWWCAPGGPDTGHVMTGYNSSGYNIGWFSPKPAFENVQKVCWDVNETLISSRKWIQVLFVGPEDAVRYPAGTVTYPGFPPGGHARGTGGYDLGYTSPDHRDFEGSTTRIHPQGGTLAGFKTASGDASWFQEQDDWTATYTGPSNTFTSGADKATRFKMCLENLPGNILRSTMDSPAGPRVRDFPGQIPAHPVRVVFEDDTYNAPKGENYNEDQLTWHWDNIQIFTSGQQPPPSTTSTQATTSTTAATTTTSSTTIPASTSTSAQPSSTSLPTTTTVPGTPTTSPDVVVPRASLEELLASLNQLVLAIQNLLDQ